MKTATRFIGAGNMAMVILCTIVTGTPVFAQLDRDECLTLVILYVTPSVVYDDLRSSWQSMELLAEIPDTENSHNLPESDHGNSIDYIEIYQKPASPPTISYRDNPFGTKGKPEPEEFFTFLLQYN